jgi:hypothetical protein
VANFCEHCEGQRFDRAQVLRTLRRVRHDLRRQRCGPKVDEAILAALKAVASLELPHLELEDLGGEVVH